MSDMLTAVTESAYGKINLYLDVLGKRPDGYHNIQSVMHTVSLCDTVTVRWHPTDRTMTCTDPTLTCGNDNLCLKAANAFWAALDRRDGCRIHLDKKLPREAGLGGGSADAAAVLRALNRLTFFPFTTEALCGIGAKIGADVPFCVTGGASLAEGIGDCLSDVPSLPPCYLVISGGIGSMSTPEAYRRIDLLPPSRIGNYPAFACALASGNLAEIGRTLYNRFEDAVPSASVVKTILCNNGAAGALMTGSGTAVFGLFASRASAEVACQALVRESLSAFLCEPMIC